MSFPLFSSDQDREVLTPKRAEHLTAFTGWSSPLPLFTSRPGAKGASYYHPPRLRVNRPRGQLVTALEAGPLPTHEGRTLRPRGGWPRTLLGSGPSPPFLQRLQTPRLPRHTLSSSQLSPTLAR